MNKKMTGLFTMASSPFLAIDTAMHGSFENYNPTSIGGVLNLFYMTGWLMGLIFLYRLHSASNNKVKMVFVIQFTFIFLAEIWNIWSCIDPKSHHVIFRTLDLFWPISNLFMLVTGITIFLGKKVNGWQRYIPLLVGFWLPTGVVVILAFGKTSLSTTIVSLYSVIAWSLLGLSIYTNRQVLHYAVFLTPTT